MARDNFPPKIVRTLALRAGHTCSNPRCRRPTARPHSDPQKAIILGEAAHICAAAPGGPRYDSAQTAAERADAANGIWLCNECSTVVDRDPDMYTRELLRNWVRDHESWVANEGIVPDLPAVTLSTARGLAVPTFPGAAITPEHQKVLRQHTLTIENRGRTQLLNITARLQLPEPVVGESGVHAPAGIAVVWSPERIDMMAVGSGTVRRIAPPTPTGIYLLNVERLLPATVARVTFLTTIGPEGRVHLATTKHGAHLPDALRFYLQGTFQYQSRDEILTRDLIVPFAYDALTRAITAEPASDTFGIRKPIVTSVWS